MEEGTHMFVMRWCKTHRIYNDQCPDAEVIGYVADNNDEDKEVNINGLFK
jgi:hypothetical protein